MLVGDRKCARNVLRPSLFLPGAHGVQKECAVLLQTMHAFEFFFSEFSLLPQLAWSDVDNARSPTPKQELHVLSNKASWSLRFRLQLVSSCRQGVSCRRYLN